MRQTSLFLVLAAFGLIQMGCGDDGGRTPPITLMGSDGGTDAGPSGGSDGGTTVDSGPGTPDTGTTVPDTGTPPSDGGTSPGSCGTVVLGGTPLFPALPDTCTPRCSADTASAVQMCTTAQCQQEAIMADTTPPTTVTLSQDGMTQPQSVDCLGCVGWQGTHCAAEVCPTETVALLGCAGPDCSAENAALDSCVQMNLTAYQACAGPLQAACFPGA